MAKEGNSFQIVLSNIVSPAISSKSKLANGVPHLTSNGEAASDLPASSTTVKLCTKLADKRKSAETPVKSLALLPESAPPSIKKRKYERKTFRSSAHENDLLPWARLTYNPNSASLQAMFSNQPNSAPPDSATFQALSSSYIFSENLGIIRARLRKEHICTLLKKSLARQQLTQNQQFCGISYKPGSAFVEHQNKLNIKSLQPTPIKMDNEAKAVNGNASTNMNQAMPLMTAATAVSGIKKTPAEVCHNIESESSTTFVCSSCKRSDTKKYAKNLCQTCYKRQKKNSTEKGDDQSSALISAKVPAESIARGDTESLQIRGEWNGRCCDCDRSDVRHYAKGRCTGCYRKARNKAKKETTPMINGHEESTSLK